MTKTEVGPRELQIRIFPRSEGAMAMLAASEPVLEVGELTGTLSDIEPGKSASFHLELWSSAIRECSTAISEKDKKHIDAIVQEHLLLPAQFPKIIVVGTLAVRDSGQWYAACEIELRGARKKCEVGPFEKGPDGWFRAKVSLKHSDFKIRPATAFFGALRSADAFEVEVAGQVPALTG